MSDFEDFNGKHYMTNNFSSQILEIINHIKNNKLQENSDLILLSAKENPRNLNDLFEIGVDCAENGKVNDASIIFERLKSCNVNDVRIPYNLGFLYTLKQDYQRALSNFHEAYEISPNDSDVLIMRALFMS
jgi:tetratricopeptide (TPR) repeat protein